MQATAPTRALRTAITVPGDWPTSRAFPAAHDALGRRGPGRCRPSHGPDAAARPAGCGAMASIAHSTPRHSLWGSPPRPGRRARARPTSAYLALRAGAGRRRPTAMRSSKHPGPRNGCWSNWPQGEAEPTKYWLSTLPADIPFPKLVDARQAAGADRAGLPASSSRNSASATMKDEVGAVLSSSHHAVHLLPTDS